MHPNKINIEHEIERRWLLGNENKLRIPTSKFYEIYHRTMMFGKYIHQGYIKDPKLQSKAFEILNDAIQPNEIPIHYAGKIDSMRIRRVLDNTTQEWSSEITIKDGQKPKNTEYTISNLEEYFGTTIIRQIWDLTNHHRIRKFRHTQFEKGHSIVYDAFADRIMLIAEIEFESVEAYLKSLKMPGKEVTFESKYSNKNLGK